ncbi:gliding motility-associated C-terminal domain-containing protein [Hymenobacter sp. DG25A]|uniref:T9SS type B sorting domain-containing protein n=1 Tax=Hymenobacter sp. DG25A TaxID=1385663 RepID=UPI0012F9688C|nr:gliding motility-associated C-terminal domain-containing protein [Hymenobacter sp. DG25A]
MHKNLINKHLQMNKLYSYSQYTLGFLLLLYSAVWNTCDAQTAATCDLFALDAPKPQTNEGFASSGVSVGKRFAIVGEGAASTSPQGHAYIYEYVGGVWVYRQTLSEPYSEQAIYGASTYINDTTALVAAYNYTGPDKKARGAIFVYTLQGKTWVKTGLIVNSNPYVSSFGWRIAKSGTDVVVGSNYTGEKTNAVAVYRQPQNPEDPWTLVATLSAPSSSTSYDYGYSVDIQGDHLLVGAVDAFGFGNPAAYFYRRNTRREWEFEQVEIYPKGCRAGFSASLFGNYAAVGSDSNLGIRIYERTTGGWKLRQTIYSPDRKTGGRYGFSVAMNAKMLLVSDPFMGGGAVYRYEQQDGSWNLKRRYTAPQPKALDLFGGWVEVDESSSNLIIGAPGRISGGIEDAGQAFVLWNPAISPAGPFCEDASAVQLQASATGGTWAGKGIINTKTGQFDPAQAGVGTHTISYSISGGGCTFQDTTFIQVSPRLRIARNKVPVLTCAQDTSITLTANLTGGSWSGKGIMNSQIGTFKTWVAGPGRHVLTYEVADMGACSKLDTISVVVQAITAQIQPLPRHLSCARDTLFSLSATPVGGSWQGKGILESKTGLFSSASAGPGRHVITYTLSATGACGVKDTTIIVVEPIRAHIVTQPSTLCRLDTILQLSATPTGGIWQGKGITDAKKGLFTASVAGPGQHMVHYKIGGGACMVNDSVAIFLDPIAKPILTSKDPVILRCGESSVLLSIQADISNGSRYEWQYAESLSSPWHSLPTGNGQTTYSAMQAGWYRVQAEHNNCFALSEATQLLIEPVYSPSVPNIFTPNHDGINDVFELKLQYPRTFHLQIFNRWGQEIFQTNTYGKFWTGTGAPEGVYYYLWRYSTECDITERTFKGHITVSR